MAAPIYVINLARSPERRANAVAQLERVALPFEFFEAVDGRLLTEEEMRLYSRTEALRLPNAGVHRELSPCEIGAALSHLRIYEKIVAEGTPHAVVMEDDVEIDPMLPSVLAKIDEMKEPWDVIWLGHWLTYVGSTYGHKDGVPISRWGRMPAAPHFQMGRLLAYPFGTHAYAISNRGARRLLDHAYPVRMPADNLLSGSSGEFRLSGFAVSPPCVRVNEALFWDTTIDQRKELVDEAWQREPARYPARIKRLRTVYDLLKKARISSQWLRFFAKQLIPRAAIHRP